MECINDDINLKLKNLKVDKVHGWDNISIGMSKLCGKSIALPSRFIFQSILNDGIFQVIGKRVMLFHVIKGKSKFNQQLSTNQPSSKL